MVLQEEETRTQLQTNENFQKRKAAAKPGGTQPSNLAQLTEAAVCQ